MRLIDADALIPIIKYTTTDNEIGVFPIKIGFDAIKGVIDEAPTIDAVDVVRCKDCKFKNSETRCPLGELFDGDGFCSLGERRSE